MDSFYDYGGCTYYGDSGNDWLSLGLHSSAYGGSGQDVFVLGEADLISEGAVLKDFHHGEDHIELGDFGTDAFLSNEGDLWTVHATIGRDVTFEVSGVTHLQAGEDYTFV